MLEFALATWMVGIAGFIMFSAAKYMWDGISVGYLVGVFLAVTVLSFIPLLNIIVWIATVVAFIFLLVNLYRRYLTGSSFEGFFKKSFVPEVPNYRVNRNFRGW